MNHFKEKIRRLAEIVALVIGKPDNFAGKLRLDVPELACIFGVDEITIKRDLNCLRALGVDIHSVRNKGILIDQPPADSVLRKIFLEYIALSTEEVNLKASALALAGFGQMDKVVCFISLCYCIENHRMADILCRDHESGERLFRVCPYSISCRAGEMILLASKYGMLDRIPIQNINCVQPTDFGFDPIPEHFQLLKFKTLSIKNELSYSHN